MSSAVSANAKKSTASRCYQLKTRPALTDQYLKCIGNRGNDTCWWCHNPDLLKHGNICSMRYVGGAAKGTMEGSEIADGSADLFADERCTETIPKN